MNASKVQTPQAKVISTAMRYSCMLPFALIFALPLWFMVISSFKPDAQLLSDTSSLRAFLPVGDLSLDNYNAAFDRVPMAQFVFNSVLVTLLTVILGLVVSSVAAFSLAFLNWRGQGLVLSILVATLIVPFETIAVPLLMVVNELPTINADLSIGRGWLNTYHVQIIPFIVEAFSVFLFYQYFRDLPRELVEAAQIDGASWFQIYRRIIMPITGPVIATVAILRFLAMWNQFLWPIMVVRSEELRPVMVGLLYFFQLNTAWGEIMAYLSTITIPVLLFYLSLQRFFIESIASSGIKG